MAEGTRIAKAYVQIIPSAKGITSKLTEEMGGSGKAAGTSFGGNLVSTIKNAIVAAGFGTTLKTAITEGADLQQSLGGVETLFKDHADAVKKSATDAYKTAGMSANDYMSMVTGFSASLIQSLGGDTQRAAEIADMAMVDMSDNANKMGTDMESIKNAYSGFAKQNYTMLDNLKLGYGGTQAEMKRLLQDAQKLTGVKYDINNLADVYAAIHVIQTELGITGTTAKEASETISGSAQAVKAMFSNVLGNLTLGNDISPSLEALEDTVFAFLRNLLPAAGNILSGLPKLLTAALSISIRGMNKAAGKSDAIVEFGIGLVADIIKGIIAAAPYFGEAGLKLLFALGTSLITYDWGGLASSAIAALRESMDLAAGEILGTDGNFVGSMLQAISSGWPDIKRAGIDIIHQLSAGLKENGPSILLAAGEVLGTLLGFLIASTPGFLESGWEFVQAIGSGLLDNLPGLLLTGGAVILDLLARIWASAPEFLEKGGALVGKIGAGLIEAIPDLASKGWKLVTGLGKKVTEYDWLELGKDIVRGLIKGLGAMGDALWEAAENVARKALNAIKGFLGIKSPSRKAEDEVGKMVPLGVARGITRNLSPVSAAMDELAGVTTSRQLRSRLHTSITASVATFTGRPYHSNNPGGVSVSVHIEKFVNRTEKDLDEITDYVSAKIRHDTEREARAW